MHVLFAWLKNAAFVSNAVLMPYSFEYFLIDPETQPPVQTSRIRLALSAVQLFIERIVRNLEPQIAPTDIDAVQWQWMKRYRVWQANREVFLWPENWLYPELRDDQSPFFQQMMSSLLQSDITDDAATSAYLDYLTSLEGVAKLEPCGFYYQPATGDTDEVSYVISRTAGAHRKYYFRELQSGSWTAWTEVKTDCEDMPITPIVWNGRLFLFWLRILKSSQPQKSTLSGKTDSTLAISGGGSAVKLSDMQNFVAASGQTQGQNSTLIQATLCWSDYYNGKWQPTKTSDVTRPVTIGLFDSTGDNSFDVDRNRVRIVPAQYSVETLKKKKVSGFNPNLPGDALILQILTPAAASSTPVGFVLYNTHSLPVRLQDIASGHWTLADYIDAPNPSRALAPSNPYTGGYAADTFKVGYFQTSGTAHYDTPPPAPAYTIDVLKFNWVPRYVEPQTWLPDAWDAPFFYEDRRYLFYVTTNEDYVPIGLYNGFGMSFATSDQPVARPKIPSLIVGVPVVPPGGPVEGLATNPAAGVDPAAIQRYLAQGTSIQVALGSALAISYQGLEITPTGSIAAADLATQQTEGSI